MNATSDDRAPILAPTRAALLAELESYEHLLFELMRQEDLDRLYALYERWVAQLGDGPQAIALCDALDDFIDACVEDGDTESAYRHLVSVVRESGCHG